MIPHWEAWFFAKGRVCLIHIKKNGLWALTDNHLLFHYPHLWTRTSRIFSLTSHVFMPLRTHRYWHPSQMLAPTTGHRRRPLWAHHRLPVQIVWNTFCYCSCFATDVILTAPLPVIWQTLNSFIPIFELLGPKFVWDQIQNTYVSYYPSHFSRLVTLKGTHVFSIYMD